MKSSPKTSPEFERFSSLTKRILSVPHAEIKRRLEAEEKQKAVKKASTKHDR
jgi:hypothetical protein